jgi:CPA1 family monovalent cation:H+ antiporter
MRGTVTLAAALALPTGGDGPAFPFRDLILVTAFGVVLGTLVVQGLTLRPLLLHLRLEDDGSVDREVRLARVESLRAALSAATECPGAETAALVRHRYELQLRLAEDDLASGNGASKQEAGPSSDSGTSTNMRDADAEVVRAATEAQRRRLVALRTDGTIGDAAFQRVEEELDWAELDWAKLVGETGSESRAR